jgi:serine/threonine-protein kinase
VNREHWQRIKRLFQEALPLAGDERRKFLERSCDGDPEQRLEVESLLAAHGESESFLEHPPSRIAARILAEVEPPGDATDDRSGDLPQAFEGRRLGPYKILRRIGQGGLGAVYLASREEEFKKQVAIKLIRRTAASGELLRRFEFERQILAKIDHPNIARLLDGGTTEDGLPYLVMEYIEGESIDRFCDRDQLSIRQRLGLFVTVCEAVEAAHRNLVVHCDIKPDNVLVTTDGTPKLLDFGIARLLGPEAVGGPEEESRSDSRILTPEYASPEQLRGEPITTASDVYSLGVLLYELLTGSRPHAVGDLSLDQAAKVVSGSAPRWPSTVPETADRRPAEPVGGRAVLERTVGKRATTPARSRRLLAGDLDSIVLKALRLAPEGRYASVEQLAADIDRFLNGFPVLARRAGLSYRATRFVGRHRLAVAAAVLGMVTILGFVGVLAVQSARLAAARDRAEAEAASARTVNDFLQGMLTKADPFVGIGGDATVLEALNLAVSEIGAGFAEQPLLEASIRDTAGMTYLQLGRYAKAEPQLDRALQIRRRLRPGDDLDLARSLTSVGRLRQALGGYETAEGHYREALQIARGGEGADPGLTAEIIARLATVRHDRGDLAGAEALYREALAMRRALPGADDPEVATSLDDLGNLLQETGQLEAAESLFRQALEIRRRHLDPGHPDISTSLNNLATVLHDRDRLDEAGTLYRRSLHMARERFGDDHPEVAIAINNLATLLHDQGALEEAEARYREALDMTRSFHGDRHPEVATSVANLAGLLHDKGELEGAESLYRESASMAREYLGDAHPHVAGFLEDLAALLEDRGDLAGAEDALREALEINRRAFGDEHRNVALDLADLGAVICSRGESDRADAAYEQALALFEKIRAEEELIAELRSEADECRVVSRGESRALSPMGD